MDNQSITHTRWNCTYHIVFIPKFRRKIMYGETKRDLVETIKKLCEMKQVTLTDGKVCIDKTGKINGRGAYICYNIECLEKAIKSKRFEKEFETNISEEIYSNLRRDILSDK